MERRHITVEGAVQGVGFRPFVYRLACASGVVGWVVNSAQGATLEVEAEAATLDHFIARLRAELPAPAAISALTITPMPPAADTDFTIRHSDAGGAKTAHILPDLATCPQCLHDLFDPTSPRYGYPFTNCTHCGPRYSIIQALPYDRANTTMQGFGMCAQCRAEYDNPHDRRFHAQPNACPVCGPQIALWDSHGREIATRSDALCMAAEALRHGEIVALKGLGGFQLLVDAQDAQAVARLRQRKQRYEKPLAVMFPLLAQVTACCAVSDAECNLLTSSAAPIVLLQRTGGRVAANVAPNNPYLGVILPYTPLHHLLLDDLGFPLVATSGNVSGEPIITDEAEALHQLAGIADVFLVHDRPIARPIDDSVLFVVEGAPVMIRRARGYAPQTIALAGVDEAIIATGTHQKNTVAIAHNGQVTLSPHLGDMENAATVNLFARTLTDLQALYDLHPLAAACDLHPDYPATRHAEQMGLPLTRVQHHAAHIFAAMAEHHLSAPVLGVAWDGTGYGDDGTIWGGEFLYITERDVQRVAHLRPFPLPGGDLAAREPRRSALGLLYVLYGDALPADGLDFTATERRILTTAIGRGINTPMTSSMGRLFDGVAALLGLQQRSSFEGQAAMALEYAAHGDESEQTYPFTVTPVTVEGGRSTGIIEWKLMLEALLQAGDIHQQAATFHNTLAAMIVTIAQQVGIGSVVLSGGCFQNRRLLNLAIQRLRAAGFTPYWPQQFPANDGGVALGQIVAAVRERNNHVFSRTGEVNQR
ncbi:MAG: carbamoyltransferase HypF [Phototrophicaceae bacterium]